MKNLIIKNINLSKIDNNYSNDIDLQFLNYPVCLINSLRRILLSELPNIVFKKIDIKKNNTNCHNEFIKHRINLLPIFRNHNWKIKTYWDNDVKNRVYDFTENSIVPYFEIKKNNNKNLVQEFIQPIYTSDILVYLNLENEKKILNNNDYFKPDLYTGEHIKLLILKNNDNLHLITKPEIDIAKTNAGYSPIGNVAYNFEKESDNLIKSIKKLKFKQMNDERKNKKLELFLEGSKEEIQFNKSFDLLDSDRIYKKNELGECNIINLNIESIGVIEPIQAFIDSIIVLKLKLSDIINYSFDEYSLINNDKLELEFNNLRNEINITLFNENHTLGNLINEYIRKYKFNDEDVINYNNYKLLHPLEEIININISVKNNNDNFNNFLEENDLLIDKSNKNKYTYVFVESIKNIISDLDNVLDNLINAQKENKFKKVLENPSFVLEESDENLPYF